MLGRYEREKGKNGGKEIRREEEKIDEWREL